MKLRAEFNEFATQHPEDRSVIVQKFIDSKRHNPRVENLEKSMWLVIYDDDKYSNRYNVNYSYLASAYDEHEAKMIIALDKNFKGVENLDAVKMDVMSVDILG